MYLQTLNIDWGQIDPKDNRRVNNINNKKTNTDSQNSPKVQHCRALLKSYEYFN